MFVLDVPCSAMELRVARASPVAIHACPGTLVDVCVLQVMQSSKIGRVVIIVDNELLLVSIYPFVNWVTKSELVY